LAELSAAFGPPGHERAVAEIFLGRLGGIATCHRDRLGSVVAELPGGGPRVMLAAHLDEVGLMVKSVTAEGYLSFIPLGSWWPQVLLASGVRLQGRKGEVRGVIGAKPPHFLNENERKGMARIEGMFIDVAAGSRQDVTALGLGPGDPAVPDIVPVSLAGGEVILGKALDDRVGVTAVIEAVRRLNRAGHPNAVLAVGTVQEEVGARGARTVAQMLHPDVCLVVEGAPADDGPGFAPGQTVQGALGGGPQIRIHDPSMIACRALVDLILAEAEAGSIACQVAVREGGGTDGGPIHVTDTGVPTVVIGIPVRYAHSQVGLSSLGDLEKTIELLVAVVRRLDAKTVGGLC